MTAFVLTAFYWILIGLGVYFFGLSVINALWMLHETKKAEITDGPLVSVLIPARDEEIHIEPCVESFMHQSYKNYEVLVLDDNSTDRTHELLQKLQKLYPDRLKIYSGKPLPPDWRGKVFAMKQLCEHANGEYLLFTDADTVHSSDSVSLAVTNMLYHKVDFLSGYITQKTKTLGEKATIPLLYLLSGFILPMWVCKWGKAPVLAVAIGQYICVKKDSFEKCGGFDLVKDRTTEDVSLAREMKAHGYKTVFLDLKDAALCRMYTSWKSCINGISKNIFDFIGKNNVILVSAVIGILIFMTMPPFLALGLTVYTAVAGKPVSFELVALWIHILFVGGTWAVVCKTRKMKRWLAFIYPLMFLNLLYIALISWYRSAFGKGYEWKGRIVH
ncbi:glycosyltransferase [Treponema sp. OMZ 840]|uniref:glycosyltransferase n=1 Tax=Treponema sp. OMZ 840 TaxID=244313 RepID=UPI003D8E9917